MTDITTAISAVPTGSRPAGWRPRFSHQSLELAAAALIASTWFAALLWLAYRESDPHDLASFYCGAQILRSSGSEALYDFHALQECQAWPAFPTPPFIRPPFYAFALMGLTFLTPRTALFFWMGLNALALLAALLVLSRAAGLEFPVVALQAAIFYPVFTSFVVRQDLPIVLLLVAAAYFFVARQRPYLAGAAAGLCAIKFHLFLLLPLAFMMKRNWKACAALLGTLSALTAGSAALVGPHGMLAYAIMLIRRSVPMETDPARLVTLANLAHPFWLLLPLTILVIIGTAVACHRLEPVQAFSAALLGSLLVAPHVYISDYLLALPACLILSRLGRVCFLSSFLLLFPLIPMALLLYRGAALAAPALALVCLAWAAAWGLRHEAAAPQGKPLAGAAHVS